MTPNLVFYRNTRGLGDAIMMEAVVSDVRDQFVAKTSTIPRVTVAIGLRLLDVYLNHPLQPTRIDWFGYEAARGDIIFDISHACVDYESKYNPAITKNRPQIWIESCGYEYRKRKPRLYLSDREKQWAANYFEERRLKRPLIGVCYSSLEKWRDYPHMDLFLRMMGKNIKGTVVAFTKNPPAIQYPDNVFIESLLPIRNLFAAISLCDVFVSPDTGPLHAAQALDVPAYALEGPTDLDVRLGDYQTPYRLPPDFKACGKQHCWYAYCASLMCLKSLSPKTVVNGVLSLLEEVGAI